MIGIGPKDFLGASPMVYQADLWMPAWTAARVAPELSEDALERPEVKSFRMVARLRPDVTAARVEAALDAIARQLEADSGDPDRIAGRPPRGVAAGRQNAARPEARSAVPHGLLHRFSAA